MREALIATLLLLAMILAVQGCAAVGLAVVGNGIGVAAGTGTAYTIDGIAYRTFTVPVDRLHNAAIHVLERGPVTAAVTAAEQQNDDQGDDRHG
jgi:hypothetical protein